MTQISMKINETFVVVVLIFECMCVSMYSKSISLYIFISIYFIMYTNVLFVSMSVFRCNEAS